ncbi:MAG: prepilin-type N-terminal cleavage/methylation domain-containing protein [Bacilli bacterium]|nr:prepilin-type N-terminal cleavage/methylation domain-containing protein [Bacilli bacterium]
MKKGFTLVELLAVLIILSLIIVIAGGSYSKVSKKNKQNQCINLKKQIENLAIEYVIDTNGLYNNANEDNARWITLAMLIKNGYIEKEDLVNPFDNTSCDNGWNCNATTASSSANYYVIVNYNEGKYTAIFNGIKCE